MVECLICYQCDMVQLAYRGTSENFDLNGAVAHNPLVTAIQEIFPRD
jgi:hypothetical protein